MYKSVVNSFFHKSALLVAFSALTRLTIQLKFSLFDAQIFWIFAPLDDNKQIN